MVLFRGPDLTVHFRLTAGRHLQKMALSVKLCLQKMPAVVCGLGFGDSLRWCLMFLNSKALIGSALEALGTGQGMLIIVAFELAAIQLAVWA